MDVSIYSAQRKRGKLGEIIDGYLNGEHSNEDLIKEIAELRKFVEDIFNINDIKIHSENFNGLFSKGYMEVQKNLFPKEYNKFLLVTFTSVLGMSVECYIKQYNDRAEFWIDYVEMKSGTKIIVEDLNGVYKGIMMALGIEVAMVEKYL